MTPEEIVQSLLEGIATEEWGKMTPSDFLLRNEEALAKGLVQGILQCLGEQGVAALHAMYVIAPENALSLLRWYALIFIRGVGTGMMILVSNNA